MAQQDILEQAKQGDAKAIASLMNRHLQPKGITVKVSLTGKCLIVIAESKELPDQSFIVDFICKGMTNLNIKSIKQLVVRGQVNGNASPAWREVFDLHSGTLVKRVQQSTPKRIRNLTTETYPVSKIKTQFKALSKALNLTKNSNLKSFLIGGGTLVAASVILAVIGLSNFLREESIVPLSNVKLEPLVPLSNINLEALVLQPGDLPASIPGGPIEHTAPGAYLKLPVADNIIHQYFERDGEIKGGSVTISLYESNSDLERAYNLIVDDMGNSGVSDPPKPGTLGELIRFREERKIQQLPGIGYKATALQSVISSSGKELNSSHIAFVRCHALATIRMGNPADINVVADYAKRLDKRLTLVACRKSEPQVVTPQVSAQPIESLQLSPQPTEPVKYSDPTHVPLGGDLTLDITSAITREDGLVEVIGGSSSENHRLRFIVNCQEKTFAMTANNFDSGQGEWIENEDQEFQPNPAFAELVCP